MKKTTTKTMTLTAVFAAIAVALCYYEIPVIPGIPFLKLDFSFAPVFLCAMFLGSGPAFSALAVLTALSAILTGSPTAYVGTAVNFVLGVIFILGYHFYITHTSHKHNKIAGLFVVSIFLIVLAAALNYFVVVPAYQAIGMYPDGLSVSYFIWGGILPLNLLKWPLLSAISSIIYRATERFFRKITV